LVIGDGEEPSLQPPTYEEYMERGGLHIVATDFNGDYLDHFREERVADFGR
jgi:hypothetical protein